MPASDKHSRTEPPSPKKRKEARAKGQVARSPDVAGWAAVVVASFILPWYFETAKGRIVGLLAQSFQVVRSPSSAGALVVLQAGLRIVVLTAVPLGGIFALLAIVANVAQTGPVASFKAARPQLSRLNPAAGVKRLFSANTVLQLVKQVLKLVVLTVFSYGVLGGLAREMTHKQPVSLLPILAASASSILGFVRILSLLGLLIGVADYLYQRHKLQQTLKMTKEEVKEERRSSEGDPTMKGMLRKRQYVIARSRVLAGVRRADVVVTNPTHYAVALRYEAGGSGAPRVVAKGADLLAGRIKTEAATCSIPVVEDPPLARYLYAICDVDEQIPAEIYLAVARLLAFVYALPEMVRGVGVHHHAPSLVPLEPGAMATLNESQRVRVAAVLAGSVAP